MRIGILVEGQAEYHSLPLLLQQLSEATGNHVRRPLWAAVDPKAPPAVVANACGAAIRTLESLGTELVIVLLDREDLQECPGVRASVIAAALRRRSDCRIEVVIKNRKFENWLIADLSSLSAQPARFHVSRTAQRSIQPNRADTVDGIAWLKRSCLGPSYQKVEDSKRILSRSEIVRMGKNSRSFRRFLRVLGHPEYAVQSSQPAT